MNQNSGCGSTSENGPVEAAALRQRFAGAAQEQVFRFWDELNAAQRRRLLSQAAEIDLEEISALVRLHLGGDSSETVDWQGLEPAPFLRLPQTPEDWALRDEAGEMGEEALRAGRVAAFTVAGGQGTRLGHDGPKGTVRIGPVSGKSLFEIFADKLHFARARHGRSLPWLIMTSHANHEATKAFFIENRWFGLRPEEMFFFRQGRMPAVDFRGKILLEAKDSIAMSPDGHGGSLRALCRSGALDFLEERGIDVISYFQVDNPLVRAVDPVFIGHHLARESDMSSKTIPKAGPEEKVGVFCLREGKTQVVEYSDLPPELASQRDGRGGLCFEAGSIAIHLLSTRFARSMGGEGGSLPFHRADKKISSIDGNGNPVEASRPNGVKFEMFVFDALPFASNPLVMETRREEEFSPVKNADGDDSITTCRRDLLRRTARWLRAAGVDIPTGGEGVPSMAIEISESFAADEESFVQAWKALPYKPVPRDGLIVGD